MKGYIVDFFKYPRLSKTQQTQLLERVLKSPGDGQTSKNQDFLTFGEYDRVCFSEVTEFWHYRNISEQTKRWEGKRHTLLLYTHGEPSIIYKSIDGKNEYGFYYNNGGKTGGKVNHRFIVFSMLSLTNEVRESMIDYNGMISWLTGAIKQAVSAYIYNNGSETGDGLQIKFEIFGSFNSTELIILWFSEQYTDVFNIMEKIRFTKLRYKDNVIPLIFTICSIILKNHYDAQLGRAKPSIQGQAFLQIAIKDTSGSAEDVVTLLKSDEFFSGAGEYFDTTGEYDILVKIPMETTFKSYPDKEKLHYQSDNYKRYFLQTNTLLAYKSIKGDIPLDGFVLEPGEDFLFWHDLDKTADERNEYYNGIRKQIENNYIELRSTLKNLFPKTAGTTDSLDLMYSDFLTNAVTTYNNKWRLDFEHQFDAILKILLQIYKMLNELKGRGETDKHPGYIAESIDALRGIFIDYKRQIDHLANTNQLTLEIPDSHLYYTGHHDFILCAYYGIVKEIISRIYTEKSNYKQSELVPILNIDFIPQVTTEIYFEDSAEINDQRLLNILLPSSALLDIPCGMCYLLHELFHFKAPLSRESRNMLIGAISFTSILLKTFTLALKDQIERRFAKYEKIIISNLVEKMKNHAARSRFAIFSNVIYNWDILYTDIEEIYAIRHDAGYHRDNLSLYSIFEQMFHLYMETNALGKNHIIKMAFDIFGAIIREEAADENFYDGIIVFPDADTTTNEAIDKIKSLKEEYLDSIKELESDFEKIEKPESIKALYLNEVRFSKTEIFPGFSEVRPDIYMINYSGMTLVDYLLFLVMNQNNKLISPANYIKRTLNIFRVGMIIKFFHKKESCTDRDILLRKKSIRDEFIRKYICSYYSEKYTKKRIKQLIIEAGNWYDAIVDLYGDFLCEYSEYANIVALYWEHFKCYTESAADSSKIKPFLQKHYENLNTLACSTIVIRLTKSFDTVSDADLRMLKTDYQAYSHNYFQYCVAITQTYNVQKPMNELHPDKNVKTEPCGFYTRLKERLNEIRRLNPVSSADTPVVGAAAPSKKRFEYSVGGLAELIKTVNYLADIMLREQEPYLSANNQAGLWYRGHKNSGYSLLPSVYRQYKNNIGKTMVGNKGGLCQYQNHLFEEFKFRVDGSSEMIDKHNYRVPDYIALMQHYNVPSSFLDWTEDILSALYFSLEPELDPEYHDANGKDRLQDAALYLFDPVRYNIHRSKQIERFAATYSKASMRLLNQTPGFIPNLSIERNEELFYYLMLGDTCGENAWAPYRDDLSQPCWWPMAVHVPRINERIKAQSGFFLAYNIYCDNTDKYGDVSLESIESSHRLKPFMYKITIKSEHREEIARFVKGAGVSKEKIYPELCNIGLRVKY